MYEHSQSNNPKDQSKKTFNIRIEQPVKRYAHTKNQFKLTNNPKYNQEATLSIQKMKNIAKLLTENKITSILYIYEIKLLNTLEQGFRSIRETNEPHLHNYTVKQQIEFTVDCFVSKINKVCKNQAAKSKCLFMIHMKILFGKGKSENSKTQMLRINSKVDRQTDEADYFDRNMSKQAASSAQKANKVLKKKKEQKQKQFTNFKQQMQQMLSCHQSYLNKKN